MLNFVKQFPLKIEYFSYFRFLNFYLTTTFLLMKKNYSLIIAFFIVIFAPSLKAQTGTWTALTSGTTNNFLGVYAPSTTDCYVSGFSGDIRKTTNGGLSWTPLATGTPENLFSVFFTNTLVGYAVGNNGAAIKTTNGGLTWAPMSVSTTNSLKHVWFFDANTGYISGGVSGVSGSIFKTTDAGVTWTALSISATNIITSVYFTTTTNGCASCISGTVYKTVSGGTTWGSVPSGTSSLQAIEFTSASDGIVASQTGTIARTTTSGTSWSSITSGTSDALTGMDFYDASNGVIVGGDFIANTGTILTTNNSGVTWSIYTPGSSRLVKVNFFDANTGYAVGNDGTILKWAIPAAPVAPDGMFTSSAPGCVGQTINFYSVMSGIPGVTHSWDFGIGATPATSTSINPSGVTYSTNGAKIIKHIVTTTLGSDTITNLITINPSPIASFSSTAPVCAGTVVDFSNTGATGAGVTYSWDFGSGSSPINSTSQFPTGILYSTSGSKNVTIVVTNQYGCTTATTQLITINSLPAVNAGTDSTICQSNSVQIGTSATAGYTYSWSPSSTLSNSAISNPIASPIAPTTTYTVSMTNATTGCSSQDNVTISMLAPFIANAGADNEICKNDSAQIGTGSIFGQSYLWSPGAGLSDSTIANPKTSPTATTTYKLTVSGNGCPAVTDLVTVVVNPIPVAAAGIDDTITVGSSTQFNASGGVQYSWYPTTGLSNSSVYNPIATPAVNTYYTVTVTNAFGCKSSDVMLLTVFEPTFWVPTAFTPDGNGVSDVFYIRGEGILDLEFTVYNRWGEQIFISKDVNVGWDGTRESSGEKLPAGAYVYQIKGMHTDGTAISLKGIINLIR